MKVVVVVKSGNMFKVVKVAKVVGVLCMRGQG